MRRMHGPLLEPLLELDLAEAAGRLAGIVRETPLVRFPASERRVELRLKLECLQETGSFKARGAWNNVAALSPAERAAGVVTVSSGNHGQALAWAARRAGVRAAIAMPRDAYPNKIQACRDLGAEVLLGDSREDAERLAREREAAGAVLIHPYDRDGTIQGAGTVGREILAQWPAVELILVPVGGGGLLAGCCLAARGAARVVGVEPEGAPTMTRALAAGAPVPVASTSAVQGLCPPAAGRRNTAIVAALAERVLTLGDLAIFAAQRRLVREGGWVVEPAGAAAAALVLSGRFPEDLLAGRSAADPLRVAAVVSGGNPDPEQLRRVTEDP
jgi:threonine dehydratase